MNFTTIFFDLDDTLYPASSGLWPTLKARMSQYMIERMHIPAGDVPGLREKYFREYGTTLRGLQARHTIDTQDFLAYVHDVNLADYIHPDPQQQAVLASLPTRNLIFTNSDVNHAQRVPAGAADRRIFQRDRGRQPHGPLLQAKPRSL